MIKSLTKNPLLDILALHCKEDIQLDLTWSTGQIWQKVNFLPIFRNSLRNEKGSNMSFDFCQKWPFPSSTLTGIIYDPPFMIRKQPTTNTLANRFGYFSSPEAATKAHKKVLKSAFRCLKTGGKLVVKIQNFTMDHGRLYCASAIIFREAQQAGFVPVDHFVQPTTPRISGQVKKQKTARKSHVEWWVFEKSDKKVW